MKHKSIYNRGYTLIELIAVAGILVVLSTVIAIMISFVLRSAVKTKISNEIAQNGNYALTIMSNTILNSDTIVNFGNGATTISPSTLCPLPTPTPQQYITVQQGGNQFKINCNTTPALPAQPKLELINNTTGTTRDLIDTNYVKIDTTAACSFTCRQKDSLSTPIIDIQFKLINLSGNFAENKSGSTFKTSVTPRNYSL